MASARNPTASISRLLAPKTAPGPLTAISRPASSGPTKIANASIVLDNALAAVSCVGVSASSGSAERCVGRTMEIVMVANVANA